MLKTILNTKPAALGAVIAAALALAQVLYLGITKHTAAVDYSGALVALLAALYQAGWIHPRVTPVAQPRIKIQGQLVRLVPEAAPVKVQAVPPPPATAPPGGTA